MKRLLATVGVGLLAVTIGCATDPIDDVHSPSGGGGKSDGASGCPVTDDLSARAHDFMAANGLILPGEEVELANLGISIRWHVDRTVARDDGCLLVMRLCTTKSSTTTCDGSGGLEVLAQRGDDVMLFEHFLGLDPETATLRVKVQELVGYYTTLSGPSAINAEKALSIGERSISGFGGVAVKAPALSFDPTPGRTWQVPEASYDLRNVISAEVYDIQAYQLEADWEFFWGGSIHQMTELGEGIVVHPWRSTLFRVLEDGSLDADDTALFCKPYDNTPPSIDPNCASAADGKALMVYAYFNNPTSGCYRAWCDAHLESGAD
ncbi:MAG: hypothetical protein AB7O24_13410 [Kofleriaceae bacterium]